MQQLLTRADDFGASPGTNEAILAAVQTGLIRNVGIMAPAPWLEHQADDLRRLGAKVCLGLHATLNSEWDRLRWGPVLGAAAVPSLVRPDGTFHGTVEQTHRFGDPQEGKQEIRAQLERVRALGLEPRYLDCHMAFNWRPDWDRALGELALEEGLCYHAHGLLPSPPLKIEAPQPPTAREVLRWMRQEGLRTALWVFHPARRDRVSEQFHLAGDKPSLRVAEAREREYRFLTDPRTVRSFLSSRRLELVRYDQWMEPVPARTAFAIQSA